MPTILDKLNIIRVASGAAAGTGATTSNIVDMAGYDGVIFIASLNTLLATSVVTLQLQENTANSTSGMANAGAAASYIVPTGGKTSGTVVLETLQPLLRFVQAVLTIATADCTVDNILAIQYQAKDFPTGLDASVLASLQQETV